jgi:CRISPR/Cas system CSM-associated protein Csm3 (group 7 of RAMP superfamily)
MRYRAVLGKLVARTAIHIGSGHGDDACDAFLRRDVRGRWVLPGTALAGALRGLATRLAPRLSLTPRKPLPATRTWCLALEENPSGGQPCGCVVCGLFGDLFPGVADERDRQTEETGGRASRLLVFDASPEVSAGNAALRDLVGIDRVSGTAARDAAAKFDLEVLPAGTTFFLRLELDASTSDDEAALLAAVLSEWREGRAVLGGRSARGLGAFTLEEVRLVERDLTQPDGLLAYLDTDRPWEGSDLVPQTDWLDRQLTRLRGQVGTAPAGVPAVARSFAWLRFDLQALGPFLTHDARVSGRGGFDHALTLMQPDRNGRPVLPGSSLRGVLRSHAERIARTLVTRQVSGAAQFGERCPACDPLSRPTASPATEPLASCDALLQSNTHPDEQDVRNEQLCLACRLFGSTRRGSRLLVEDAPLKEGTTPQYKVLDFLALDRFTGGGREGAKFDALALWRPCFRASLRLDNPEPWELGWLALVLRDLAEGRLRVGFGAAKGFGQVTIPAGTLDVGFLTPGDFPGDTDWLKSRPQAASGLYRVCSVSWADGTERDAWRGQAEAWVRQFAQQIDGFERFHDKDCDMRLRADSYFDRPVGDGLSLADLYPTGVQVDG